MKLDSKYVWVKFKHLKELLPFDNKPGQILHIITDFNFEYLIKDSVVYSIGKTKNGWKYGRIMSK